MGEMSPSRELESVVRPSLEAVCDGDSPSRLRRPGGSRGVGDVGDIRQMLIEIRHYFTRPLCHYYSLCSRL